MFPKLPNTNIHCEINHGNRTNKIRQCRYRNRSGTKHMGILHKNIRQKARGGLQAYSLCSLRGPLTTKNLHLNFNYTWISIMIGAPTGRTLFSSLRSNRQERPTKSPLKMVIPAKRWPKMAPNIGMLHRNPRQKGLGGQRAIASLLYRPSGLPDLFGCGFR